VFNGRRGTHVSASGEANGGRHPAAAKLRERIRTLLFLTADREDLSEAVNATSADAVLLDLEDGVAPARRAHARMLVRDAVRSASGPTTLVRMNIAASTDGPLDAELVAERPDGMVLPMARTPGDVLAADEMLTRAEQAAGLAPRTTPLLLMIETTAAVMDVTRLIAATPRVAGVIFGQADFVLDVDCAAVGRGGFSSSPVVDVAHGLVVFACAAAGVPSIAPAFVKAGDDEALEATIRKVYDMGYSGVIFGNPGAVHTARLARRPSDEDLSFARGVVGAAETAALAGSAVASYDGWFVEGPYVESARRVVARAEESFTKSAS
jgi:citrate lyase subunit beta / citryl-CoA lyase